MGTLVRPSGAGPLSVQALGDGGGGEPCPSDPRGRRDPSQGRPWGPREPSRVRPSGPWDPSRVSPSGTGVGGTPSQPDLPGPQGRGGPSRSAPGWGMEEPPWGPGGGAAVTSALGRVLAGARLPALLPAARGAGRCPAEVPSEDMEEAPLLGGMSSPEEEMVTNLFGAESPFVSENLTLKAPVVVKQEGEFHVFKGDYLSPAGPREPPLPAFSPPLLGDGDGQVQVKLAGDKDGDEMLAEFAGLPELSPLEDAVLPLAPQPPAYNVHFLSSLLAPHRSPAVLPLGAWAREGAAPPGVRVIPVRSMWEVGPGPVSPCPRRRSEPTGRPQVFPPAPQRPGSPVSRSAWGRVRFRVPGSRGANATESPGRDRARASRRVIPGPAAVTGFREKAPVGISVTSTLENAARLVCMESKRKSSSEGLLQGSGGVAGWQGEGRRGEGGCTEHKPSLRRFLLSADGRIPRKCALPPQGP